MENEISKVAQDYRTTAMRLIAETENTVITNEITLTESVAKLKLIKGSWKYLDTERKKGTKPMDDAKKVVMAWFRPILVALKKREDEIKAAGVKYLESRKTDAKMEGANLTERWHAIVIDKSKIPLIWLEPKMTELNALATASKCESPIPGIKFVKESGMASSSK